MHKFLVTLFLVISSNLFAQTTINIPVDYSTIQAGLNAAIEGDTVLVASGTYYENIIWPEKNKISLIGQDMDNTIIDGSGMGNVININPQISVIDSSTLIQSLKITNGGNTTLGGGILIKNCHPKLSFLLITDNFSSEKGGGIYTFGSSSSLSNIKFYKNTCDYGGGMYIENSNIVLANINIYENTSKRGGGLLIDNSKPTLTGVYIYKNTSHNPFSSGGGGGIFISSSNPTLTNVDIYENSSSVKEGGGGGGIYLYSSNPILTNVNIHGNISTPGNTNYYGGQGGGMYLSSSSPILTNVNIYENSGYGGSGMALVRSNPILTKVNIYKNIYNNSNRSSVGGGISLSSSDPTLTDVDIYENTSSGKGGGMSLASSSPTLTNVNVYRNISKQGGGIALEANSNPTIFNVTISENIASYYGGGVYISSSTINNTSILRNTSKIEGGGIYVADGLNGFNNAKIKDSNIFGNYSEGNTNGVYVKSDACILDSCNIDNGGYSIFNNDNANYITAINNWFGNNSGPYHPTQNPTGLGDSTNQFVTVIPWLTEPNIDAPPIPAQDLKVISSSSSNIILNWSSSEMSDFSSYKIYYDTDSSGYPYSNSIDVGTDTVYTLTGLLTGTNYYIAVTTTDTDGNESWYSREVEAIPFSAPEKTELLTPVNNSIGNIDPIVLKWSSTKFSDNYNIQIATDNDFSDIIVNETNYTDTGYTYSNLNELTTYYWRVRGINSYANGNWSEVWSFKTLGKPTETSPLLPLVNSINQPIELDFVWSKSEDQLSALLLGGETSSVFSPKSLTKSSKKKDGIQSISNYWFELNIDTTSSAVVVDSSLSDTTKHVSELSNLTDYYWRVRAKNQTGWGGYSSWSKFTTIIDTPTVVVLESPLDNSKGNVQPISVSWLSSKRAESYNFQLSTDANFTTMIIDSSAIADTFYVLPKLNNLTTYYWRVNSKNIGGTNAWSDVWNFKTLGEPTESSPLLPLVNSINQPIELDFVWSKSEDQLSALLLGGETSSVASPKSFIKSSKKKDGIQSISNYWFELNLDTASTPIVIDSSLSDTTKHVSGLTNLTDYYWRVRAKNETGWGSYSNWSKFTTIIDTPTVVVLESPLDNSKGNVQPISVNWLSSKRADNYRLQISTDASFTLLVVDSSAIIDTFYQLPQLNNLTTYFWRVNSMNIGGTNAWSKVWNFKTLGEPTESSPLLPLVNSVNQPIELDFVWSKAEDQLSALLLGGETSSVTSPKSVTKSNKKKDGIESISNYWFELNLDTASTPVVVDSSLSDTTKHVNGLTNLTNYYWRVRAKNETGWGGYSNWSKFTTIVGKIPSVVLLNLPINNSVGLLSPIELKWFTSIKVEDYNLQVSLDSLFSTTIIDTSGIIDTTYIVMDLNNLTKYYWRVNAKNILGSSNWSEIWSFKTLGEPAEVSLISPVSDTTNLPTSINFIWSKAIDKTINIIGGINNQKNNILTVSNYWFELTKDVNSNPTIIDSTLTDTTKLVSNLEHSTEYWWHIKSKNEVGWSNFTAWSKFTTIINIPDVVVLLHPAKDSKNNSIPVTLSWNKSDLAESYLLQLSTDVNFATTVLDSNEIADTSFILAELNYLTTYYWRIKADNIGGASEWSEVWSFATLGVPTAPNLIFPENNLELADTTNSIEFIWNSVGIVDSYTLEASTNENFDSLFVSINDLTDTNYAYSNQLIPGTFYWRVNAKNQAGIGDWSNIYSFTITLTDVDQLGNIIPQEYVLHQNYPNPFNPTTMVKYGLPEQSNIKIEIFNMLGQSVGVLVNSEKSAGFYETTWNAENLPSGIYLINIRAEGLSSKKGFTQVKKALLLK